MATKIAASNIQAQSSAQLAGMISDPTGSGKFVLDTAPTFSTSITVNGTVNTPPGQFAAYAGSGTSFYNAGFRNDGVQALLLSSNTATTAAAAATTGFNSFRPFFWNLSTGAVTIDGTGIGTGFGGAIVATGDVTAFSDIRVKTNIATITNAISTVQQLRGVSFTRSDTGLPSIGVIAQEIQQVHAP